LGPFADIEATRFVTFEVVAFLAAGDRTGFFEAGAGSRRTFGDPMPDAW